MYILGYILHIYLDICLTLMYNICSRRYIMSNNDKAVSQNMNIKRQRFLRIAENRVNKILSNLDNLARCANKRNYEYSDEEARKIFREIERKVKDTKFQFQGGVSKGKFKL